jgi:competence protein ComEA
MKPFFRNYLTLNKRERNGIFVLLGILCVLFIWMGMQEMEFGEGSNSYVQERVLIKADTTRRSKQAPASAQAGKKEEEQSTPLASLFPFDPNTLDPEGWVRLGLKEKQVHTIRNYLSKGGKFKKAEDLQKIYGVSEGEYQRLAPYIQIPSPGKEHEKNAEKGNPANPEPPHKVKTTPLALVELNSADSAALEALRCIGPGFAKRIVTYRKLLGGFHDLDQLHEVYGMDEDRFHCLITQVTVDSLRILKLNPNKATLIELRKHPYIHFELAKLIVSYRERHGDYKQLGDLRALKLLDESQFKRLLAYLTLN